MGILWAISVALVCSLSSALGKMTVTRLPGFNGTLPFELETGYVEVDEVKGVNLFYYFFKSERSPSTDPLLLWMIGGPGCSGLSALERMGPLAFDVENYESDRITPVGYRKNSFSRISNIIFLDSLAGSGFSFSRADQEEEWTDTRSITRLNKFIRKWLLDHPEFISNHFYVAGDSYGGKMVPLIAHEVIKGNEAGEEPLVNIKGYIAGNPITSNVQFDIGSRVAYFHGMGLISEEQFLAAEKSCKGSFVTPKNDKCRKLLEDIQSIFDKLNDENILAPRCDLDSTSFSSSYSEERRLTDQGMNHLYFHGPQHEGCKEYEFMPIKYWADHNVVREALGVSKEHVGEFIRCPTYLSDHYRVDIPSSIPYHLSLTTRGFRSLVYSGDHDPKVNFVGTLGWTRSLNFSIIEDWHPWLVDGQVGGFIRAYANNLTFATVKGAGHIAASSNRRECVSLFDRWLRGKSLQ